MTRKWMKSYITWLAAIFSVALVFEIIPYGFDFKEALLIMLASLVAGLYADKE